MPPENIHKWHCQCIAGMTATVISIPRSIFHCVISMRTVLCSSCVCQLLLKNFMMMMMMMMDSTAVAS